MTDPKPKPVPKGYREVFVRSYFHKKAKRRLYAASYGLEAFRFLVKVENEKPAANESPGDPKK